jgi:hypothetical protein
MAVNIASMANDCSTILRLINPFIKDGFMKIPLS